MPTFGKRLKKSRLAANLTLEELANKVGSTKSAISRYENDLRTPNGDFIKDVANTLNVSTDYLLGVSINKDLNDDNQINTIAAHLPKGVELTEEERNELTNYANYIISKRKD